MQVINRVLSEKYDNHILPFLWMHGESKKTIHRYITKIADAGIGAVCLESRPHPEYLQDKWWYDVEIVLDECRQRGMKVWMFDDQHFPTGYAGGALEKPENLHLKKLFLAETQLDFSGPQLNAGILVSWAAGSRPNIMSVGKEAGVEQVTQNIGNKIIAVLASRKSGFKQIDSHTTIDLTDCVVNGTLIWNIPEGDWTISVLYTTQEGGEVATEGYLNPLVAQATDVLLSNVYQAHYDHFSKYFGETFAGFFSDEPRFGNAKGPDAEIGKKAMVLPWSSEIIGLLAKEADQPPTQVLLRLPSLFHGENSSDFRFRYAYMQVVTKLYQQNFSQRIGDWCRAHKAQYIGHVIEDNNAHARLGYGAGHFFRSMAGQDMAGIDVVLHQLLPQQDKGYFNAMTSTGWDGEFFHYALAELGTSLGRLDPTKSGQTMCEIFGAFGWSEDITFMKWLADHMLVRGVNQFVPHAFSMKSFPDPDCPPHLYADGKDPQYEGLSLLMNYMNRVSTLLSHGKHVAHVAVLYHGEAEWSGKAMLMQKVTRKLVTNQVGFEIVPTDWVVAAKDSSQGFQINETTFQYLFIPYSQRLPQALITRLIALERKGVKVIFIEKLPSELSDTDDTRLLSMLGQNAEVLPLKKLDDYIKQQQLSELQLKVPQANLRYYHYQRLDGDVYMFFNESTIETVNFRVIAHESLGKYDPMTNQVQRWANAGTSQMLSLEPSATAIMYSDGQASKVEPDVVNNQHVVKPTKWQIRLDGQGLSANVPARISTESLPKIGQADEYQNFVGTITYQTQLKLTEADHLIELESASGMVKISVDGQDLGTRIGAPYIFKLPKINLGTHDVTIRWFSSLGYNQRDYLSQYMILKPLGFYGRILVC